MRKIWIVAAAWLVLGAAVALAALNSRPATADDTAGRTNLPIALKPENTPTPAPSPTPTIAPSPTPWLGCPPLPTPTPAAWGVVNGGFEATFDLLTIAF